MLNDTGRSTQAILSRAHSTPADQCKYLLSILGALMRGLGYNPIRLWSHFLITHLFPLFSSSYNVQTPTLFPQPTFHTIHIFFMDHLADFYNSEARA